jgi:hypothetical protein
MRLKGKALVSLVTMVAVMLMFTSTAFAAVVEYANAGTTEWGKNGGGDKDSYYVKLNEVKDFDVAKIDSIVKVVVTIDTETYFKPQFVINTEAANWEAQEVEYANAGHYVYEKDVTGKYLTKNGYNNFCIQSGWKNEGKAVITSIEFKDASGNNVYAVGVDAAPAETPAADDATVTDTAAETSDDAVVEEEGTVVEEDTDAVEEDTEVVEEDTDAVEEDTDAVVAEDTAEVTEDTDATAAEETSIPKTGVVGFALVYGLGALATGSVAFKKKR